MIAKILFIFIIILSESAFSANIFFSNKQADKFQTGANVFNIDINRDLIIADKDYGIKFLRIAPDKFKSNKRDFLIGNADKYDGLVKEDLKYLIYILDMCSKEKMPVVLTMLSLPGSRWK